MAIPVESAHAATLQTLYSFGATSNGSNPAAGVIMDADGALYGTTTSGGTSGNGIVFKLTPPAYSGASWTESVLHSFAGGTTDGANPNCTLTMDSGGNLYGTTEIGGASGLGTVFKLTPGTAGSYTETILYSFAGTEGGAMPVGGVIMDLLGVLYGATQNGGPSNLGTVFKLTPGTGGAYTEHVLYSFAGGSDGAHAGGALVSKGDVLFGTTANGGGSSSCAGGCGTVFELVPGKGGYTESVLHAFQGGSDGVDPGTGLIMDFDGTLYGSTLSGGTSNMGMVFKLVPGPGGIYHDTALHSFSGGKRGGMPVNALFRTDDSVLYGATTAGGASNDGTLFSLKPRGAEAVAYSFGGSDGTSPNGGLIAAFPGVLYGTTSGGGANNAGTVFEVFLNSGS